MISFQATGVPGIYRDRPRLRAWVTRVAHDHGARVERIAFVLMSDAELLAYNKRFLRHRYHTDVITFPFDNDKGLEGDVLMSLDRIRDNARIHRVSTQGELRRVMVHGVLHLCGHHDHTPRQKAAMRRSEDLYLARYADQA